MHMLLPISSFILPVSGGGGLSRGKQELQVHFGDTPPATCSRLALPQDIPALAPKPAGLQGCDTASHYALRISIGISFPFYLFSSLNLNWSIQVNYSLVSVWFFPFPSMTNCFTSTHIYDLSGFFLYSLMQGVKYVSFCYMVGPDHLFCQ